MCGPRVFVPQVTKGVTRESEGLKRAVPIPGSVKIA